MTWNVVAVSAGLGQPSSTRLLTDRLTDALALETAARGQSVDVATVELRTLAHDITDHLLTGFPSPALGQLLDRVYAADALVLVTPTFSASYSGLFKSFFDILDPDALVDKPILIGATGGSARHSLVLDYAVRPLLSYFKARVMPTGVFAATADFGDLEAALDTRVARAVDELVTVLSGSRPGGSIGRPPVERTALRTEGASFEELLRSARSYSGQD